MKKILLLFIGISVVLSSAFAQRRMENLDRGLMAAKVSNGVYVNWRITGQEYHNTSYNLYKDGVKLNNQPITGASNYLDESGTTNSKYKVTPVVNGVEGVASKEVSVLPEAKIEIALQPIPKIANVPDSYYDRYSINDITAADLDGDGEYELIIKRMNEGYDSSKPYENKYYSLFEAYKLDGTFMWRIDVGPNIFHNVEITVLAYDFDGDGKAEVVMRTSEGTIDGTGYEIPDIADANGARTPDGITNYRNHLQNNGQWFEYKGPEFLSLFDGETGKMLDMIDHIQREPVSQWGPSGTQAAGLAHRATKFHYGAPYLDGKKPSLFVSRGIYYRTKMCAYDIVNKKFSLRWEFDSGTGDYCGQGNHNYSIADVDNDGRDEIVYGSMVVDDNGKGLYSTKLGHGDAIHVGDFDPYRKGLEVFACLEESPFYGTTLRAAESGEILLQYIKGSDCGRCMAANVSNNYKGAELWPSNNGVWAASERKEVSVPQGSQNFRIFWDGDLLDELVDNDFSSSAGKGVGYIQKLVGNSWQRLLTTTGYYSCNHSKGTPCLQADLFGDWREELIYRNNDDTKIAIFFTTIPTEHRIYTLMHDLQYRNAIAWQMTGYNQPPHVSYFLGEAEGILLPPPPVIDNQKLVFSGDKNSDFNNATANWIIDGSTTTYTDGKPVLFDVLSAGKIIMLKMTVNPEIMTVNIPVENEMWMNGSSGKLSGTMPLIKQGGGSFALTGNHDFSGKTEIWDGLLIVEGDLTNSPVWMNLFGELSVKGSLGKDVTMNYGSVLYPGEENLIGKVTIGGNLTIPEKAVVVFDMLNAETAVSDTIVLSQGSLSIGDGVIFRMNELNGTIQAGDYVLIQTPSLEGDLSKVEIEGLSTRRTTLSYSEGKVMLKIEDLRGAASVVWNAAEATAVWEQGGDENFLMNNDVATYFSPGDQVTFDDQSTGKTVNKSGTLISGNINVNTTNTYTIQGGGTISGDASLSKEGTGTLIMKGINNYTGATTVTGGTLSVESMPYLTNSGSIGPKSSDPNLFVLDGATLSTTGTAIISEKAVKIGTNGATFNTNANMTWYEVINGTTLTKTGSQTLSLFNKNTLDKLIISGGTVSLKEEVAYPAKKIVFESGTLSCYDNSGSYSSADWSIEVPEGKSGTINLDSRCNYTGALTGAGTLTVMSPWIRNYLQGNWSAFTGTINFTSDSDGGDLQFDNNYGLPNATLNITGTLNVYNNKASTFEIGALQGSSNATLTGDHTWTIGKKNINTVFAGNMTKGSITKTGTGSLKLSGTNTSSGTTTISNGTIIAWNTSTTESALPSGTINVNYGILAGQGFFNGAVVVRSGATLQPGDVSSSSYSDNINKTMTFAKNLSVLSGGAIQMSVRNRATVISNTIAVKGTLTVNGKLVVKVVDGTETFALGKEIKIFDLTNTNVDPESKFEAFDLPPVDEGCHWDTREVLTTGIIKVAEGNSIPLVTQSENIRIWPNPAENWIQVDLPGGTFAQIQIFDYSGKIVLAKDFDSSEKIDVSSLEQGFYLVKVMAEDKLYHSKLIRRN